MWAQEVKAPRESLAPSSATRAYPVSPFVTELTLSHGKHVIDSLKLVL